jgi:dephospho-CoA kinase
VLARFEVYMLRKRAREVLTEPYFLERGAIKLPHIEGEWMFATACIANNKKKKEDEREIESSWNRYRKKKV